MIKKEVIDEIIARNDIESLIGNYVSLKRAGSNLKGLCPFHSEKTPSFTVYPADNSFYCFGCGVGGNAITFVRQMERLDYPDAVEFLAKRAGINVVLEEDVNNYQSGRISKQKLYRMNADAAKFFHYALLLDNPKSKAALAYLMEKRGLSMATINQFGLGYAPDSFDALMNYMLSKGYSKDELVVAYLVGKSEKGSYYDVFRNKVMFPIIDTAGNVIAFGGRVLDNSKPKYRNTTDTPVFKKSRNLFALNFARHTCSAEMILCEGYMDVISLHAAGFTNAVATLGTAITPEQARIMSRYTKKVIVSYDSDEAGQKAARKAMQLLEEVGLEVGVIKTPGEKDPDDFIRENGKEAFEEIVKASKSKFEYNMTAVLSRYNLLDQQDRINAIGEIERLISDIYSKAEREIYINYIAKKFEIKPENIAADVERLVARRERERRNEDSKKRIQEAAGFGDKVNADFAKAPAVAAAEENVLGLMLLYPEHQKHVFDGGLLSEADFFTELNRRVFKHLSDAYFSNASSADDFNEKFTPEEIGRMTKMKLARMPLKNDVEVLDETIKSLKTSLEKKNAESVTTLDGLENLLNSLRNKKDGK